jgi:hypothetical protein
MVKDMGENLHKGGEIDFVTLEGEGASSISKENLIKGFKVSWKMV